MSRVNKVNKDHYTMAGRLMEDEIASERVRQMRSTSGRPRRTKPSIASGKPKRAKPR